jgi:prepilin-type N-terminal cleavage/methylation domain-containing protein
MHKGDRNGFTLIEIMMVIGILAILVAIGIPVFHNYRAHCYKTACIADGRSAYDAAVQYFLDHPCAA